MVDEHDWPEIWLDEFPVLADAGNNNNKPSGVLSPSMKAAIPSDAPSNEDSRITHIIFIQGFSGEELRLPLPAHPSSEMKRLQRAPKRLLSSRPPLTVKDARELFADFVSDPANKVFGEDASRLWPQPGRFAEFLEKRLDLKWRMPVAFIWVAF